MLPSHAHVSTFDSLQHHMMLSVQVANCHAAGTSQTLCQLCLRIYGQVFLCTCDNSALHSLDFCSAFQPATVSEYDKTMSRYIQRAESIHGNLAATFLTQKTA